VHHIRLRQLPRQERDVGQLGDDRPQVLDAGGEPQPARQKRIDGHQPGIDIGVVAPLAEQAIGLNGLAAEDSQSGRHDGQSKLLHVEAVHRASACSGAPQPVGTDTSRPFK
jgi:hypothetical protein